MKDGPSYNTLLASDPCSPDRADTHLNGKRLVSPQVFAFANRSGIFHENFDMIQPRGYADRRIEAFHLDL